jgi:excisionase family DNA binding protein
VNDHLLEAHEVAELLNVPESWVRDKSRQGEMPCIRLGRYVRYERDALEAWIATRRRRPLGVS